MVHPVVVRFVIARGLQRAGFTRATSRIASLAIGEAVDEFVTDQEIARARRRIEALAPGATRPFQTGAGPF